MEQENRQLREEIEKRGGFIGNPIPIPSNLENEFLRNMLAFDDAMENSVSVMRLFPENFNFPPCESMTTEELARKLEAIYGILEKHDIFVELKPGVPDNLIYEFLREELPSFDFMDIPNYRLHIDGCDGYCPECFQRSYCSTGEEIWSEDLENPEEH